MALLVGLLLVAGLLLLVAGLVAGESALVSVGLVAAVVGMLLEFSAARLSLPGLLLLVAGLLLLAAELLLPSGFAAAAGALLLVAGLTTGWSAPRLLLLPLLFGLAAALLVAVRSGQAAGLADPGSLPAGAGLPPLRLPPGATGTTVTSLRPGGTARFDGQDVEVRLREGSAAPGMTVAVVAVQDRTVLVDLA